MKEFESIYKNDFEDRINQELIQRPSPIFLEMENYAKEKKIPILSPASGIILKFLCSIYKPDSILELGTGLGYSTAWMLSGFPKSKIITIDRNSEQVKIAESFISKMYNLEKVHFTKNFCLDYLIEIENLHEFDFIFVDCDKIAYPEILDICLQKSKKGTILIFDNVLWHGRIFRSENNKPSDNSMREFWRKIKDFIPNYELFASGDGLLQITI